jgi:hypothetical protein
MSVLAAEIIPHLVSRLVYTGAGGFDPTQAEPRFVLSPRVSYLQSTCSSNSVNSRGIFHTKDEPLCRGYHRLHVICGESLCSQLGMWLKIGTTALVVALVEAGLAPGKGVMLASPLRAMRRFAGDTTCKESARLRSGARASAIEIQRHYLQLAEACAGESFMPGWAPDLVPVWREVLDRLEAGGAAAVATQLDWAIKHALYRRRAGELVNGRGSCEVPPGFRHQLCEIDARFGQLGKDGVFAAMDRAGVLDHQIVGLGSVEQAMRAPPKAGRARLRGEWVRRLSGNGDGGRCDWNRVWDLKERRVLDLSNPFEAQARWRPFGSSGESASSGESIEVGPIRSMQQLELMEIIERHRAMTSAPRREPERRPSRRISRFSVGDRVAIRAPENIDGARRYEWVPEMAGYVGRTGRIVSLSPIGDEGLVLATIDYGEQQWTTLTRNLVLVPLSQRTG